MRKQTADENGLILVELLAVLAIGSIVMLLISGVLIGVQNKYENQKNDSQAIFDLTYIAKVISKDFRMAKEIGPDELKYDQHGNTKELIFHKSSEEKVNYRYESDESTLYKNKLPIITDITVFSISKEYEDNTTNAEDEPRELEVIETYKIKIKDKSGKTIETELIKRK